MRSRIDRDEARARARAMDAAPKTKAATLTVGELRAEFHGDAHHRRRCSSMHSSAPPWSARTCPRPRPTTGRRPTSARRLEHVIGPDRPAEEALAWLDSKQVSRLIVLDDEGRTLLGLICMDATRSHFCVATRPPPLADTTSG